MTDSVGQRLRGLRVAAGWSQAELARLVNETHGFRWLQTTVQKIEAGTRPLTLDDLEALADVFDLGLDDLVHGHLIEREPEEPDPDQDVRDFAEEARRKALKFERHALMLRIAEIDAELEVLAQPPFDVDDRGD